MIYITSEQELDLKKGLSALYFYRPQLPVHKKMEIIIKTIETLYKNIKFYAIDADQFKSLYGIYCVNFLPQIIIVDDNSHIIKSLRDLLLDGALLRNTFTDIYDKYNKKILGETNDRKEK